MAAQTSPFAELYIPTQEDYDDVYACKKPIEHIEVPKKVVDEMSEDPCSVSESPINRETPYYAKGSKDKLKAACEPNDVLVSRDSNDKGAKSYQIVAWNKWLKKTARYDTHDYECLRGNVYPYMDIESEKMDIDVIEMLNHSIGVFVDALQQVGIVVEGVALANSSRPGKHSFHVVLHTDKVFESTLTLKEFIMTQVKPRFAKDVSAELLQSLRWSKMDAKTNLLVEMDCIDWAVYTTDRVMRFLNQSKIGKKVKLAAFTHDDIILPCPFLTEAKDFLIGQYGQCETKPIFAVELPQHIQKIKEAKESGVCAPTVELPPSYLSELADIIPTEIIQSGTTCCKFIWAMARSGASNELIHKHCQRTSNYDKAWVEYHIQHAAAMNVNIGSLRYWASQADKSAFHSLSKKYMKEELSREIHSYQTSITTIKYHERFVRPFTFDKVDTILLKSHLGTGKTTQLVNSIQSQPDLKRILIISGRKSFTKFICGDLEASDLDFQAYDEAHVQRLSSINRLVIQVESLWRLEDGFDKYDLVAVDESETVAHQFYSEATHRHNMIKNHIVFERCISTATKVLFADAFLGNRTVKISESLRNIQHSEVIENTYCPYERKAIQLFAIDNKGRTGPAISYFCNQIVEDLDAGLKVAVVWGSKNKAKAFCDMFLKETKHTYKLYSSESSPEERDDLADVENNWKYISCLNYTSTITVGVNYDPEDTAVQFDKLYLYACAAGGLPRDTAQALLRCRKIKSNTLIYTVDTNALQTALYGRESIRAAIADKERVILQQNPIAKWERAPKWAEENYIENENENGAKCIAFNDILNGYLEKSGYTIETRNVEFKNIDLKTDKVEFDDIKDVSEIVIERIKRKSKAGYATHDEKLILQKHRFCKQFKEKDAKVLSEIWKEYMMEQGTEHLFWHIVGEKHQTTDEYIEYESSQKYIQQSSKKCLKRIVIDKFLSILGIENTCQAFKIDNVAPYVEQLKALEKDAFDAFQCGNHGSRRSGDFTDSNAVEMIKMVFKAWNGDKVVSQTKKKQVNGIRKNTFAIEKTQNTLWDLITSREVE